jgi:predicted ABC-type ATPase
VPSLLVVAGPNGSGKTTLTSYIRRTSQFDFGEYTNPDDIAAGLSGDDEARFRAAQAQAEQMREECLRARLNFSMETVMSHPSKLDLMQHGRLRGYDVLLFFVGVEHPDINIARVAQRVRQGGHDVPTDRIVKRYMRTMSLLPDAVLIANRSVIFDNTAPGSEMTYRGLPVEQSGLRVVAEVRLAPPIVDIEYSGMRCAWVDRHLIEGLLERERSGRLGVSLNSLQIRRVSAQQ